MCILFFVSFCIISPTIYDNVLTDSWLLFQHVERKCLCHGGCLDGLRINQVMSFGCGIHRMCLIIPVNVLHE